MSDLFHRIKKRFTSNQGGALVHDWREVYEGPLKGLQLYLPSGEGAGWAERFLTGGYEPEMLAAFEQMARSGGTLYDIGAHIGYYSCAWLKLGGDRVEAFEPASYNREILLATIERNRLGGKIRVHDMALGDREGTGTLLASRLDVGAASAAYLQEFGEVELPPGVQAAPLAGVEAAKVAIRKLDGVVAEMELPIPAILKIDVEGAEAAVLAGASALLAHHHPAIMCEVHSIQAALTVADRLAGMGYVLQLLGKNGPHVACLWKTGTRV